MPIDFRKLGSAQSADTVLAPRDIFAALPAKHRRYQYPRDVQTEVWTSWFTRRDEKDVVIKMNTGSGKTVVGLILLKSCLNEKKGPAVYVTPDKYLTNQVLAEASALGLETTTDPKDADFLQGRAILVINIYKLINGRSVFGVRGEGQKIRIGSLLVDDAHACLATTQTQFSIDIPNTSKMFAELLDLFRDDLKQQSRTGVMDIEAGDPVKSLLVPFWAWHKKSDEVARILHKQKDSEELLFVWPLLEEVLPYCSCVMNGRGLEISSRCLPIDAIPSFAKARRRVFMTATLADDSILVTDFDVNADAAVRPISPSNANDVGERLILVPQELNPEIDDDAIRRIAVGLAKKKNVVVIVPSMARSEFWKEDADEILMTGNLDSGIEALKAGHVGLVVIVNRYDGIDLPDEACRILVLDGLPEVSQRIDRIEETVLDGTDEHLARTLQRIEQGMGRGIRSSDDWCVVILMGRSLTKYLYIDHALDKFTPATRAQYDLSQQLAKELRKKPLKELVSVVSRVIGRDPDWVRASKGALVSVKYDGHGHVSSIAKAQRNAFSALEARDYTKAAEALQEIANTTNDPRTKGWLKQQLAEVVDHFNPVEAQVIQKAAVSENRLVLKPIDGIGYNKLQADSTSQGARARKRISTYRNGNELAIASYDLLDALQFIPNTAPKFERAFHEIAQLCGLASQRPELLYGTGPDNLVALGRESFLVIECKNGATSGTISKSDSDQLNGSMIWFSSNYQDAGAIPIMIHPTNLADQLANTHTDLRVMSIDKLKAFKEAFRGYTSTLSIAAFPPDLATVDKNLDHYGLIAASLVQKYTIPVKRKK